MVSCSTPKQMTYFTAEIRQKVENSHQPLQQIQFYADRDIVLRRDLDIGETKVTAGKVTIVNGKSVNVVKLAKKTPGVCTLVKNNLIGVSFENGDNRFLAFGKTRNALPTDPYRILANDWVNNEGYTIYDGKKYHILEGAEASLQIKSNSLYRSSKEERKLTGRTVPQ